MDLGWSVGSKTDMNDYELILHDMKTNYVTRNI